LLGRLTFF